VQLSLSLDDESTNCGYCKSLLSTLRRWILVLVIVIAAWRSALLVQIIQIILKKGKQKQKQNIVNSPAGA